MYQHQKILIRNQNTSEYNPLFKLLYNIQLKNVCI